MQSIRAVCVDVGWTLAHPRRSIWEIFAELCVAAGAPATAESCEQLICSVMRGMALHAETQFRSGAQYSDSDAEFAGMFAQMGRLIFAQMGVSNGQDEILQDFLKVFWSRDNWSIFPEVLAVLTALRDRGVTVGVLSNAPSDLPTFLEQLGILPLLDFAVVSAAEGIKKPDRRIFEAAVVRAGVSPGQMLHVGDMYLEDVLGARAAGLQTLLIERNPWALFPNFRESEGRAVDGTVVIRDLAAVLDHLR